MTDLQSGLSPLRTSLYAKDWSGEPILLCSWCKRPTWFNYEIHAAPANGQCGRKGCYYRD